MMVQNGNADHEPTNAKNVMEELKYGKYDDAIKRLRRELSFRRKMNEFYEKVTVWWLLYDHKITSPFPFEAEHRPNGSYKTL